MYAVESEKIMGIEIFLIIAILTIITVLCLYRFIGISKCVGEEKYSYKRKTIRVKYDEINLYGQALIPKNDNTQSKFPTVIYAHGADSNYKSDIITLKSLAKSGIACYTFDFYGWTKRSTGPKGRYWFRKVPREGDNSYEQKVLQQVEDLNAVIEAVKEFSFVDEKQMYLLGSSMGGATVAAASVTHTQDIKGIILQYPAMNLVPEAMCAESAYDVHKYGNPVLLLQGTCDEIVPEAMSAQLSAYYSQQCKYIIYPGQPHVFSGKYKVIAAEEIYNFILSSKHEM